MAPAHGISKSPTGIVGFDDLTLGGLPTGRPTLVCGSAGCGKTLFASTFLIHGARWPMAWTIELWSGAIYLAAVSSYGLAALLRTAGTSSFTTS